MRLARALCLAVLLAGPAVVPLLAAPAAEKFALDRFLDGLTTWRADFSQTLRDAKGRVQTQSNGQIVVARPGRFRWELRPPNPGPVQYSQLLLSDGRNLWFYDRDLEQVTVKPASVLTAAPAALLAGGGNWRELFLLRSLPKSSGFDWVEVRPRRSNAEFREAKLGFASSELRRMVLRDNLGQVADIEFRSAQRNPTVPPALLEFVPPAGVDVIGKPIGAKP